LAWGLAAAAVPTAMVVARASAEGDARYVLEARLLYWTPAVVVVAAIVVGAWRWRVAATSFAAAIGKWWPGLAAAVLLTAAVASLVPPRMRVQFDETSLVNTSLTMHEQRADLLMTSAVRFEGELAAIERMIDKRPPLFAFLVSVVHDVTGPRIANAFAVNLGLLATLLFLAFVFVRDRLGLVAAFAAQALLLAVPLTTVVATSAGFDLLAAVLLGVVMLAARDFVEQPDRVRAVTFVAAGTLFAWSRYESLFAFVLLFAIVAWRVRRRWEPGRAEWGAIAVMPGLLLPLWFLLLISRHPNFYPEAGGRPLLALEHAVSHGAALLATWFAPSLDNPLPGVVGIAAVAAWLVWFARRRTALPHGVLLVPLFGVTLLVSFWFASDPRDPIALRLWLPFAFFTALSPLLFVAIAGRRSAPWLLGVAALLAVLRTDAVRRDVAFPRLDGQFLVDSVTTAVTTSGVDEPTTLWVTTVAQHLITTGRMAMEPRAFTQHQRDVRELRARGEIRAVCVVQTGRDGDLAGGFGDPRDVLARTTSEVIVRIDGAMPVTVHRLR